MNGQTAKACLPKNKRKKPAHNQGNFSIGLEIWPALVTDGD